MLSTSQVAQQLGVSRGTIANYGRHFAAFLSAGATPARGQARQFTDDDIRVLHAAKGFLDQGLTYAQAVASLGATDLETLLPPAPPPPPPEDTAMVPFASVQLVLEQRNQELARVLAERDQALARVAELERELGRAQERSKGWLRRLLGR